MYHMRILLEFEKMMGAAAGSYHRQKQVGKPRWDTRNVHFHSTQCISQMFAVSGS